MKKIMKKTVFVSLAVILAAAFIFQMAGIEKSQADPRFRPAKPGPIIYTQPDGTELTILLKGDERMRYAQTGDGFTVMQNEKGVYYYATLDPEGSMKRSNVKASDPGKRNRTEKRFLKRTQKNLFYSSEQIAELRGHKRENISTTASVFPAKFPSTGNLNVLVLLIGFTDVPFTLPQSDFYGLMNEPGFNGTGCFKEYHLDNSFDQLNLTSTVMGPYTAANDMAYYGTNRGGWDARPRTMVSEAIDAAEAEGLDFSQFDNDGDGNVDGLIVIHAGYDEAAGAPSTAIWSHAWDLGAKPKTYDGVVISDYVTTPELSGISGTDISDIGVLAHEFGHSLGLPDTYDTNYETGGQAYGPGYWDVMADGGWNNGGFTPANHTAYAKYMLGWQTPIVLDGSATSITLPNSNDNNISCLINTTTTNEYFMLENRQQTGWDAYVEGHGLLIYHVDANYIESNPYDVNVNPDHQGFDLEEADGIEEWGVPAAGDPFPGATNNTSFTDDTSPNSISWAGDSTGVPITNIAENGGVITFDVGGSSNIPPTAEFTSSIQGLSVDFTDQSSDSDGTIVSWDWDFGDSSGSANQNPSHTYAEAGTYTVTLTVTDNGDATDTIVHDVTVSQGGGDIDMFVNDITVIVAKQGKNYKATATITILSSPSGDPVSGANVSVTWSGAAPGTDSGTTLADGTISFTSDRVGSTGPFTITVDNATHSSLVYNPALNVETSDSGSF